MKMPVVLDSIGARLGVAWLALCCGALSAAPVPAVPLGGVVLHVDDDAALNGDGLAWSSSFRHLQDAFVAAIANPAVTEIRVGQGTYVPDRDEGGVVTPGDRDATFLLPDGVSVLGGFAGIKAADPDRRDIALFPAVLSGDLADDDGPGFANDGENAYHVVTLDNAVAPVVLDGFTVTAGNADLNLVLRSSGGGICSHSGSVGATISHCTITANRAWARGGGMHHTGSQPTLLVDSVIRANESNGRAGGVSCVSSSGFQILRCTIEENVCTESGGGLSVSFANVAVDDSVIRGNTAFALGFDDEGGGGVSVIGITAADDVLVVTDSEIVGNEVIGGEGGGLWFGSSASVALIDTSVRDNIASSAGGGICGRGSLASPELNVNSLTADGCTISGNTAGETDSHGGGGISASLVDELQLTNCRILDNESRGQGGGLLSSATAGTLSGCVVANNHATAESGGGVQLRSPWPTPTVITSCTIMDNESATSGGGLAVDDPFLPTLTVNVFNTIVRGNTAPVGPDLLVDGVAVLGMSFSNLEGGPAAAAGSGTFNSGPGNLDTDPLFVDPANGDYHLLFTSPGRNAGSDVVPQLPVTDFEGDPRVVDGAVDQGADEFHRHLYVTGEPTPGGDIAVRFVGDPGSAVILIVAFNLADPPLSLGMGELFVLEPWLLFFFPVLPADGLLSLPATLPLDPPGPYTLYLQSRVGPQLTNLWTLAVE